MCHAPCHSCDSCKSKCNTCCDSCGKHRIGLLERIRSWFHKNSCSSCCQPCCTPCTATPAPAPVPVQKVQVKKIEIKNGEISKEYLPKVGHGSDYGWITGQLFYVHADKGIWVVRYAPVDREDRYGGSVVLAPVVSTRDFQDGDLVTIHGDILNEGRASRYLGGPSYRTTSLLLEDRPK